MGLLGVLGLVVWGFLESLGVLELVVWGLEQR